MVTVIAFDFVQKREKVISPAEVSAARSAGCFCWADVETEHLEEVRPLMESLGFNFSTVVELLQPDRLSSYDAYPDFLHFVAREASVQNGALMTVPLDILINDGALVTFHRQAVQVVSHIRQTYREDFLKFSQSPGFLLYEIADHLIEGYRKALLHFGEAVQQVQSKLFGEVDDRIFQQVSLLNRDILTFRRTLMATRELMHELASRKSPFISATTLPFLEMMADTLDRLGEDIITERDVLAETLNLYMGMVSHRTGKVLKRLTMISIIFLPLTFLCGVYGMNFQFMPETHWKYAYAGFWLVVAGIAASLLYLMKRFRWL